MSIYAYFFDRAPRTAFIQKFLPDCSLGQLRLGERNYLHTITALLPPTTAIRLLAKTAPATEAAMLCEIRAATNNVLPNDIVIIADMTRYPITQEFIEHLLQKALICPDIPLRIMGPGTTACPAWFICQGAYLLQSSTSETATVNAAAEFLDLHNPEATMQLFSGSLVTRAFNVLNVSSNGYF